MIEILFELDSPSITMPPSLPSRKHISLYFNILAEMGGISSITEIHTLAKQQRPTIGRAQVSKLILASPDIKSLGAGYYCFYEMEIIPVEEWLCNWLKMEGRNNINQYLKQSRFSMPIT